MMLNWLNPLLRAGAEKKKLTIEDMYALPPSFESQRILDTFNASWTARTAPGAPACRRPPVWQLIGTLWNMFAHIYVKAMGLKIASDMFKFVGPLALRPLLLWLGDIDAEPPFWAAFVPPPHRGYYYVLVMF